MTDNGNLAGLVARVETISDATAEQHAAARTYLERMAPDLIDVVFGSDE